MIRKKDPQAILPYLKDASNYSGGSAEEVVIPENESELQDFLLSNRRPLHIAGAGTGLTASRIPHSGVIVSMERFDNLGGIQNGFIEVGPAVTLASLQEHLRSSDWFYPPNPTETLASLGGTAATNASGGRSYKYGVTRDYILEADLFLADGRKAVIARGQTIDSPLQLDDGSAVAFPKIGYTSPTCKNAAGYHIRPGMDWLDLFIGSDGTLGIFTRLRLKLLPRPDEFISGVLFFQKEEDCWRLVETIRSLSEDSPLSPCSLEYFDSFSLEKLRGKHERIPAQAHAALFFEQDVADKAQSSALLEAWYEFLSGEELLLDDSWFAQTPKDLQRFHDFRHDIPVIVNEENSREGRVKVGTDMAVPNAHFMDMMRFYREELKSSGLHHVVFGHLGDNHLHINLLPAEGEMEKAKSTYGILIDRILQWNGTVSAEHGIGKLKKSHFARMVGEQGLKDLKRIKTALDPHELLGSGNIL